MLIKKIIRLIRLIRGLSVGAGRFSVIPDLKIGVPPVRQSRRVGMRCGTATGGDAELHPFCCISRGGEI
ncbi:MAG: hypothetical protein U9N73_09140 [Candidatus Auribacterota bacterium]|nr:hypothetical protein [Candidatus Auribacterota bacterium]